MKTSTTTSIRLIAALLAATGMNAEAITITTDTFTDFDMDFAEVGDTTNVDDAGPDGTAHGAVSYTYRMGVNEVSRVMIDDYNSNMGGPSIDMSDMTSFGGNGDDKPATGVSWNEAARFVNWLNTSQGYQAAYLFETPGANDNISLWTSAEAWQLDGENLYRHKDAYYFLPSEDEWYKAAFYDGNTATYYNYATGSDSAPTTTSGGTTSGTAVYRDGVNPNPPGPADITNAGGLSYYGTMAQNGNVWEWGESASDGDNDVDPAVESRVRRGGFWGLGSGFLQSSNRNGTLPDLESPYFGFRVASVSVVPEPSSVGLLVIGAMGCVLRRKRG